MWYQDVKTPCTTHAPTHARPSLPVNQNPNPTPSNLLTSGLHDTAVRFFLSPCLCYLRRVEGNVSEKVLPKVNYLPGLSAKSRVPHFIFVIDAKILPH